MGLAWNQKGREAGDSVRSGQGMEQPPQGLPLLHAGLLWGQHLGKEGGERLRRGCMGMKT